MGRGYVDRRAEEQDTCIIAVVGSGMKGTPGVAARMFTAVSKRKLNVRIVAQGSSVQCVLGGISQGRSRSSDRHSRRMQSRSRSYRIAWRIIGTTSLSAWA